MGDFSMVVESMFDRSTSSYSWLMGVKEELAWADLKNKYNIKNDGPLYSWDNLREDGIIVLARQDRFCSFSSSL